MTEFVFEDCRVQVDAEATRAYYDAYGEIAGGCGCAIAETLPPRWRQWLPGSGRFWTVLAWISASPGRSWSWALDRRDAACMRPFTTLWEG